MMDIVTWRTCGATLARQAAWSDCSPWMVTRRHRSATAKGPGRSTGGLTRGRGQARLRPRSLAWPLALAAFLAMPPVPARAESEQTSAPPAPEASPDRDAADDPQRAASPDPASEASSHESLRERVRRRTMESIVGVRALETGSAERLTRSPAVAEENGSYRGAGSGVIVDGEGWILTCAHVIGDAQTVRVFLSGDRESPGRVVVTDRTSDLALVKVGAGPLTALDLRESPRLHPTAEVYLASRSGGAAARFMEGALAAPGTYHVGRSDLEFFKKFFGQIEPGDSGGALVDVEGRFIGLLSVGVREEGVGYAIAREFVLVALTKLRSRPPLIWPWLGIGVESVSEQAGARIWTVVPGSPAERAGLRPGDRVVSLDGRPVEHFLPAMLTVISRPVGSRLSLGIERTPEETARKSGGAQNRARAASRGHGERPGGAGGSRTGSGLGETGEPDETGGPTTPGAAEPPPKKKHVLTLSMLSAARPIEPVIPVLDQLQRLTGIRLEGGTNRHTGAAELTVVAAPDTPSDQELIYGIGSRLIAVVPGVGLVRALEEGRTDQEIEVRSVDDLSRALGRSTAGGRLAAALIWMTEGRRETLLLSGEIRRHPLM